MSEALRRSQKISGYGFIAPAVAIYVLTFIFPIFYTVFLSLFAWRGVAGTPMEYVGLANYTGLLSDSFFWDSLENNIIWFGLHVTIQLSLGFIFAVLIYERPRGWLIYRNAVFMPVVISVAVVGMMFQKIYNPLLSPINELGRIIGWEWLAKSGFLSNPQTAIYACGVVSLWRWTGLTMVLFIAGLQAISPEMFESARICGATRWQTLRHVTIPLLKPIFAVNLVNILTGCFQVFDLIWVMASIETGPPRATSVLSTYLYVEAFKTHSLGVASAIGVFELLIAFIPVLILLRVMKIHQLAWR